MSTQTKRVALPADFINVGAKSTTHAASVKPGAIPVPVQLAGIILGVFGVMSLLNTVLSLATRY